MNLPATPARLSVLPLALAAAFPFPVSAQQTGNNELQPVVVTATRTESRADELLSDVVVIDRAAIERQAGRTLTEVLAREAGVQMHSNGGLGKTSSLYIRGTENRHALLLIDGVRYGSATTGAPSWDNLPIGDIERIEVLKGPASALYGSDAIGGVVQIFTRRGREGFHPHAAATAGSEGHREWTAGLSGGAADIAYAVSVRRLRDEGFSSSSATTSPASDRDGFEQDSLSSSLDWTLAPGWKVDARAMRAEGTSRYDATSGTSTYDIRREMASEALGLGLEGRLLDAWKSRLAWGRSKDDGTDITSDTARSRFDTLQTQWLWQNEVRTGAGLILAGYEQLEQAVDTSPTSYAVRERTVKSLFGGLNGSSGAHHWQVNARRDKNSQFGTENTWLLAYGLQLSPELRAHVSRGTAFKAPTFNQLYYPRTASTAPRTRRTTISVGNPHVLPESARNTELGLTHSTDGQQLKLIRFDNRIRNLIEWTSTPVNATTSLSTPTNVDEARIKGWTLGWDREFGALQLHSVLDLLDARNARNDRELRRRSDRQLTVGADYALSRWKLGATVLAASDRFDDINNTVRLPGYGTVDLHADYAFSKEWSLQARVNNAGDKGYETASGYHQSGRRAYLTLRYQAR